MWFALNIFLCTINFCGIDYIIDQVAGSHCVRARDDSAETRSMEEQGGTQSTQHHTGPSKASLCQFLAGYALSMQDQGGMEAFVLHGRSRREFESMQPRQWRENRKYKNITFFSKKKNI